MILKQHEIGRQKRSAEQYGACQCRQCKTAGFFEQGNGINRRCRNKSEQQVNPGQRKNLIICPVGKGKKKDKSGKGNQQYRQESVAAPAAAGNRR